MDINYSLGMLRVLVYGLLFFCGGLFVSGLEALCSEIRSKIKSYLINHNKYDTLPDFIKRHLSR